MGQAVPEESDPLSAFVIPESFDAANRRIQYQLSAGGTEI